MSARRKASPSRMELAKARDSGRYNIGQAARASGVSAKMIRHYEAIGLVPAADRTVGNYRVYDESDVHTLRFVQRARSLGFSMKQVAELLSLWRNRARASASVRRLALEHISELESKIRELEEMVRTLRHLAHQCRGDARPECPILDNLALADRHQGPRA